LAHLLGTERFCSALAKNWTPTGHQIFCF